ncbi:hypothetical protein ACLK19_01390 [Escherichia coli]
MATNDVRFIDSSDFDAHEIRVAIHDGFTLEILNAHVTIGRSNICVAKRRCVSCLPTSPKPLPTPLTSPTL